MPHNQSPPRLRGKASVPTDFNAFKDDYTHTIEEAIRFAGQPLDFFARAKAEHLTRVIQDHRPTGRPAEVLDIGCGHGIIHPHLARTDCQLSGIDVATEVVEIACQLNPQVDYRTFNGKVLPFDPASFDVVFMICVLHHIPPSQWLNIVTEARRVLRPGGAFVVFEHNPLNPITQWIVRHNDIDADAVLVHSGHLKKSLRKAGFTASRRQFILFTPLAARWAKALDRALGWLPLGAQYFVVAT